MPYCAGCEDYHKDSDPCKSTVNAINEVDDRITKLEKELDMTKEALAGLIMLFFLTVILMIVFAIIMVV